MEDSKMLASVGLAICVPFSGRPIAPEWALCFAAQNYPLNMKRFMFATKGKPVDEARNELALNAIKAQCKYIWFLDDDVAPPFHAVRSLINQLENADEKTMVCGGIYCYKYSPTEPVVFRGEGLGAFWKWNQGDVFEVTSIGTGCMLIKTEVFEKIPKPWFKTVDTATLQMNDDIWFCQQVREAGFKILADGNSLCTHLDWDGDAQDFVPYELSEDTYPLRPISESEPRCKRTM
jgi:GT2 family glycosyltransferase